MAANKQSQQGDFKYFAFISYNKRDTQWGKRLQRKLESYRLPAILCSERGWQRKPLKPIFFAPTDIQPGGLSAELEERLRASRNLIVICSPNSAQSEWVGKEIEYFNSLDRAGSIHFFIVDGEPNSNDPKTECFNPIIKTLGMPEFLGANVNEKIFRLPWLNRERAYVQLITKLLGVEFDSIWKRHKRLLVQRIIGYTIAAMVIVAAMFTIWHLNQPFDVNLKLREVSTQNKDLPPLKDAIVTLILTDEIKTDTIKNIDDFARLVNIPHKYRGVTANISIRCKHWTEIDTTLVLDKQLTIDIRRDEAAFGNVYFRIFKASSEEYLPNIPITIAEINTVSDSQGKINLSIPLHRQRTVYKVDCPIPLEFDSIYMPSGESDIIVISEK